MRISTCYAPEKCTSKDKERPHLGNPYLDVAAERVVATDGHRLVAVPVEVDKDEVSGYLAGDLLKVARKKNRKNPQAEIRDRSEIVPFDIEWPCAAEGCVFPDWQKVLPTFRPGDPGTITVGLNARLLKGIADALGCEGGVALTVRLDSLNRDPSDADDEGVVLEPQILVRSTFAREGELGVLMPMRLDPKSLRYVPPALDEKASDEERREALDKEASVFLAAHAGSPSPGVAAAVQAFKDSIPEGTTCTVSHTTAAGETRAATVVGKGKRHG